MNFRNMGQKPSIYMWLTSSLLTLGSLGACTSSSEQSAAKKEVSEPAASASASAPASAPTYQSPPVVNDKEVHLTNIRQLTFEGENAEAYFNKAGDELIFQAKRKGMQCDQIFRMNTEGKNERQVSVGEGRTTCAFIQNDDSIVYASTHAHGKGCLWSPDHSLGYVWPIYPEMDIWRADADGENASLLFQSEGYDAEATICPVDGRIVFTSTKNGDLDLYTMNKDGSNVVQITDTPGYDGGAFFSPDCSKIIWRASRPEGEVLAEYQKLLKENLVRPSKLEIYVADADGKNVEQLTNNGAANFAPYMNVDNNRVLYVSNKDDPKKRNFDIFMIDIKNKSETRITYNETFDGFPMFTHDGKRLVFASNRNNAKRGDTNIFIADWID